MVHVLLHDLPTDRPYRVILMRRKLEEVLDSQAAMLARNGKDGAALPPDKIARVYARQLEKVVAHMQQHPCFKVLEVWYDVVLKQPLVQAGAVNEFLGGRLDASEMASVVDLSLYRQRS